MTFDDCNINAHQKKKEKKDRLPGSIIIHKSYIKEESEQKKKIAQMKKMSEWVGRGKEYIQANKMCERF